MVNFKGFYDFVMSNLRTVLANEKVKIKREKSKKRGIYPILPFFPFSLFFFILISPFF